MSAEAPRSLIKVLSKAISLPHESACKRRWAVLCSHLRQHARRVLTWSRTGRRAPFRESNRPSANQSTRSASVDHRVGGGLACGGGHRFGRADQRQQGKRAERNERHQEE